MIDLSSFGSATIVAPHPDDETIGAFGLIRALRDLDARVSIIVVSDGSASHHNSREWPKVKLVAQRKKETVAAMALAGIAETSICFLAFVDGGLHALSPSEKSEILDAVISAPADLLVIPEPIDDHPDHRAIGQLLAYCPSFQSVWAYRVWPPLCVGPECELRHELGDYQPLKRQALALYATQLGLVDDDPTGFTISPELFDQFCAPVERFRKLR